MRSAPASIMTDNSKLGALAKTLIILAIIGAVNWGLIGFFNFNLVDALLGGGQAEETSAASRVVYAIVGLAGVVGAMMLPKLHVTDVRHRTARSAA